VPKRIAQSKTARKKDHEGTEAPSPQDSRLRLVEPPPGASTVEAQIRELEQEIRGASHRPVSDLLADWVHRLRVLTEADGAVVAMRDAKGIVCHASSGQAPEVGSRLQPDSSLTRECFENGRLVICEDVESDPRIPSLIAKTLNLRSALIVPIKANQSVFGVIEVLSSRPFAFNAGTVAAVQAVAVPLARLLCPKPASRALNPHRWLAVAVLIACLLLLFIALRVYRSTSNRRSAVLARPASGPSPSGQRSTDPSSESRTSSALRVPPTTATASNNPRDAGSHRLAKPSPGQSTSVAAITAVQRNSSPGKEISREESPASVVKLEAPELSNLLSPARLSAICPSRSSALSQDEGAEGRYGKEVRDLPIPIDTDVEPEDVTGPLLRSQPGHKTIAEAFGCRQFSRGNMAEARVRRGFGGWCREGESNPQGPILSSSAAASERPSGLKAME